MMANSPTDAAKAHSEGVGRNRPPLETRFQKGKSGNPRGRPPKSRDLRKLVEAELDQLITISENGKRVRLTKREIMIKKLVNGAVRGDEKPLQALLKLIGPEPEPDPVVAVTPDELARFALRHLSKVEVPTGSILPPDEPSKDEEDAA